MNIKTKMLSGVALVGFGINIASASLVVNSFNPISGSGLGAVNTALTVQQFGTESGCVGFGRSIGTSVGISTGAGTGGACTGSGADVKTGASQTQALTLAQAGVTSAANFGIVFNADQPAGGPITLNSLTTTFFNPSGTELFQSSGLICSDGTLAPCKFDSTATGIGKSGFLITLNASQQAAATAAGAFNNSSNVVGLAASLTQSAGGPETFFIANTGATPVGAVPEPMTMGLMGGGLGALIVFARRRKVLSV